MLHKALVALYRDPQAHTLCNTMPTLLPLTVVHTASFAAAAGNTSNSRGSNGQAAPAAAAPAQASSGYKQPPKEILDIVDAPPQPALTFSPDRSQILQLARPPSLPPIFEISRPELKLAGVWPMCVLRAHAMLHAA